VEFTIDYFVGISLIILEFETLGFAENGAETWKYAG